MMYCVIRMRYRKSSPVLSILLATGLFGCSIVCQNCRGQSAELTFTLAPGLSIEKVAGEPLVKWPMLADWDSQGRLVVVESAGVSKPVEKHNEQLLHRVVRLVDDNGDGVMDRRIVAADKLPFSEGVLCFGNDMLVTAPPHIWKLTDNDGDGYCEYREIWFDGQTLTGCANDLHGPYLGRDGWVYWCKGAFAKQRHELIGGQTLSNGAAHIHRRRQFGLPEDDKSGLIEPVMSGGMDNPVEVASLPNGERFFTSTFLVHPGDGKRDGVAHAIYGGAYGKDHNALNGVLRTGSLMPIMAHMGAVAPSGLACLDSGNLVGSTSPTLVAALFNMQKVTALTLQPSGATYQATPIDLAIGSRIDFHPTDILEDADGSLLVIDTGGWYDLCCPTSRVDQFTAPGGIYRIRGNGAASTKRIVATDAIDWNKASPAEVVELLGDQRPWVAREALIKIASSGDWATESLRTRIKQNNLPLSARIATLWALGAAATPSSLESVTRQLLKDSSSADQGELQHVACNLVALHRFRPARPVIEKLVQTSCESKQFALARAAIEALGKIGNEASVALLFEYAGLEVDRVFDHSLRYALYELNSLSAVAKFLDSPKVAQRKLALSTLDLLSADEYLTAAKLVQATQDETLTVVATELLIARPQHAQAALEQLAPQWKAQLESAPPSPLFRRLAAGWRDQVAWQQFTAKAFVESNIENSWKWQEVLLQSRAGTTLPPGWFDWIIAALKHDPEPVARLLENINLSGADQTPLVEHLVALVQNQSSTPIKRQLLVSLPPKPLCDDQALLEELATSLGDAVGRSEPSGGVWKSLKRLKISPAVAEQVMALAPKFSPTELIQAVELVASIRDDRLDQAMLSQLAGFKAARAIPTNSLINVYRDRSAAVRNLAKKVADQLLQSDPQVKQTVQTLLEKLPKGDPVRGLTLYHSSKANCGACHQMGYRGGKIGPELSKIGGSRTREAILEAVLFPSQRIEQGFDSSRILTVDGRVLNGIVLTRTDSEISLRVAADKVEIIPLSELEEQRPSDVSIMPGGMLELLNPQEIADLLSLLEVAK
jgi:putative heme-binding domain-containing protein